MPAQVFAHWPKYRTLNVGERTVLVGGFVTDDMAKFAPACQPSAAPVPSAAPMASTAPKKKHLIKAAPVWPP